MQNDQSAKHGARKHRRGQSGNRDVLALSPAEFAALERGQTLKRYVRAAAAMVGLFDDTTLADKVQRGRLTVGRWWLGAKPEPEAIGNIANVTGLSSEELTRFVYFDGPPPTLPVASGPSGLREGAQRGQEHLNGEDPDTPVPSPGRQPHDDGATRG